MDQHTQELQSKITFLEHTVESLNEVLIDRGREIDALTARLTRLESRLQAMMEKAVGEEPDPLSERPPHY